MRRPFGIRRRVDVERVDAHERHARRHQPLNGRPGEERVVAEVGVGPPEAVEPGVDEDRAPREVVAIEGVGVDR